MYIYTNGPVHIYIYIHAYIYICIHKLHKSDYRKFLNGDFTKSDTSSLYSHLKSHDVKIFKFQILEILENEGFKYTKDIRQLETILDAKERHWIWKLETLTLKGLNVADTFYSQNRSSRKKRYRFFTLV